MTSNEPPGTPPEPPAGPARRSRRASRTSQSYDFQSRFGDPTADDSSEISGLREPAHRERSVPGRGRLTVRQLMDEMGMQSPPATPGSPADPIPGDDTVTQALPTFRRPQPPVDLSEAATAERSQAESRNQAESRSPATPTPPAPPSGPETPRNPETPSGPEHASGPADAEPADDDAEASAPRARKRRSRPLEPTPDLTDVVTRLRSRRRKSSTAAKAPVSGRRLAQQSGRVLVALVCVLTLVGTGYMWNLKRGWNGSWNNVAAVDGNDPNIRDKDAQYGDETYLIVGTDSRSGKNAKIGGGDETSIEGSRADTILLVNIPADRSRVVAVSWPRDLQVDRPECQSWNPATGEYAGDLYPATNVKLNSVYADGGPSCMVKTLTQMSGLHINHFIAMDFEGFEKVVNVIGGVNVCSTVPLYDYELGYILRKAGTKKLTGRRALNYVRARNISAEGNGDYGRIKRQQLFLSSLLRSTLSSDVLSNPSKLNKIVKTFIEYSTVDGVDTDSLIQLADSMQGVEAGRVTFLTIPTSGTSVDGENNEIPRTEDIDAIFNAIINDKPLPGEKKESKSTSSSAAPKPAPTKAPSTSSPAEATAQYPGNVSVRVLNGSGQTGVATAVMNLLIAQGFNVPGVADASSNRSDTVVRYGAGERDSAVTIAQMFPGARIQEDATVKVGVEIILGEDFGGTTTMTEAPTPGSTISAAQLPKSDSVSELPNDLSVTNAGDTTCS
ncbi:LCP family protein [Gordonia alkaliphila]|uniref:LCP family protein n=1 Tax=Gordonia alkaliphila TaxID=1053547 RepID=A0ABP8YUK7_9ACTN|nr:LCP family protein [Gordonia alkaliphila]MCK0439600.1 LCP family protein [Gordonia alkaliphila]